MMIRRRNVSLIFLIISMIVFRVFYPFGQGVFPESVNYLDHYNHRGVGPVITMTAPHSTVEVDCINYGCYYVAVILLGNLLINALCIECFIYFWKLGA